MPHIQANNLSIYYERLGKGAPLLYIGGTGADLRVKPNVMDGPLPDVFDVIAYDQRGLGQTDKPAIDYHMSDYADDAAALIKALGLEKVNVLGVSFGGMVALNLACRHPGVIDQLVLCCTSAGGTQPSYPFHELPTDISVEERTRTLLAVNDTRRDENWQKENPDQVQKIIDYTVSNSLPEHQTEEHQAGAQRQLLARKGHDVQAGLSSIPHPTLICAGKYDGIAPAENQQGLVDNIKNSELRWYEGGHLFMIQDKRANQDIIEWLSASR